MDQGSNNNMRTRVWRYGGAVAAAVGALLLRHLLAPLLGDQSPFILFWPAIIGSSLYGGFGPGLVATALTTALGAFFLLPPIYSLAVDDPRMQLSVALFALQGVVLSGLTGALRAARKRAEADLARREQAEQRLRMQYAISRVLTEERHVDPALPRLLATIGESLGWQLGHWWRVDAAANDLHCTTVWHAPARDHGAVSAFEVISRQTRLPCGVGLPGEVWQRGAAHWLPDLDAASHVPRYDVAARVGLRSAVAFPIRCGSELIGVMEFLSTARRLPDADLLDTMATVGAGIGQFFERHLTEQAMRASENRNGAIVAAALDAIITIDHAGYVTEWNPAAERIFGYHAESALGQLLADLIIPPGLHAAHHHGLQHYLATGEGPLLGQRVEVQAIRADGTEFPVELTITRLPTDGPPVFTGFVRDLTVHKQAEEAVRFQAHLLDTVEQAVVATDVAGTIIYWNRFAETLYGWPATDVLGRNVLDVTPTPTTHAQAAAILARLRAGESWSGEVEVQRRDGTTFPALMTNAPVSDAARKVVAIVGVSFDITERKRGEEASRFLSEASAVLASSLDDVTVLQQLAQLAVPRLADWCAVDMIEADGAFRRLAVAHVDPAKVELAWELERRYGFDPNLPEGAARVLRSGQSVLYPEISDALLAAVAQDGEHLQMLQRVGLRSGMIVPLVARERTLGAISLGVAEAKRTFGPADRQLAEDLAHRAALAIDNARLYGDVQAAVRLRDEFLSVAAHELRTPITSLLGYSQVVQRRAARNPALDERTRHGLQVIEAQAERLARLVTSLLEVSRLETGYFHVHLAPLDLGALVRRISGEVQPTLDGYTLELAYPQQPVMIAGDALRLEQVLQNLIQNAVKYSPDGGPIMVSLEVRDTHAVLAVTDHGSGIPAAAVPHLFQRFFRAATTAQAHTAGMGIGLYVVHEIVVRHGGSVEVTSEEGYGSTFTVQLPLAKHTPIAS